MAPHLLVTNDFPPKVGGIQTYLHELWRRLPPDDVTVLTTAHPDAAGFDRDQPFRVVRAPDRVLLPTPALATRIDDLAREARAEFVVLDPALPLGVLGRRLARPYALVLHGSELLGRLPGGSQAMGAAVRGARHVIAAGNYPASEARRVAGDRTPPVTVIPPGVDTQRFRPPLDSNGRAGVRARLDIPPDACAVVGLSRLVPRKGFDVLIDAVAELAPRYRDLFLAIGGRGREARRLQQRIDRSGAPAVLVGRVPDEGLAAFYGAGDVFAMCCRTRWGGLEPEGFGIVFLEAAACGVPQVAGDSGGAADAVVHGETGLVVSRPGDSRAVALALETLVADPELRARLGAQARARASAEFSYDGLAARLATALASVV